MRHGSPHAAAFRRRGRCGGGLRSNGATPTTAAATAADGGRFAQALATYQALQSCRSWRSLEMESREDGSCEVRGYIAIKMIMVYSWMFGGAITQQNPCHVYCWPTNIYGSTCLSTPSPTYGWTWSIGTLWHRTRKRRLSIYYFIVCCIIVPVRLSWEILVFHDVPGWWTSNSLLIQIVHM